MLKSIVLLLLLLSIVDVEVLGFSSTIPHTQPLKIPQLHGSNREFSLSSSNDIIKGEDQCMTSATSISVAEDAYTDLHP